MLTDYCRGFRLLCLTRGQEERPQVSNVSLPSMSQVGRAPGGAPPKVCSQAPRYTPGGAETPGRRPGNRRARLAPCQPSRPPRPCSSSAARRAGPARWRGSLLRRTAAPGRPRRGSPASSSPRVCRIWIRPAATGYPVSLTSWSDMVCRRAGWRAGRLAGRWLAGLPMDGSTNQVNRPTDGMTERLIGTSDLT